MSRQSKWCRAFGAAAGASLLVVLGPLGLAAAGADTTFVGYNATTLGVGAQFAFNVPNVVPLPNENLIEEDIPFARTNVNQGPVVDALGASYYPGDVATNLGTLLQTDGFPFPVPNDTVLAESKYPASPGYGPHASYGVNPANATPAKPSAFYSTADSNGTGGDATGFVSDLALNDVGVTPQLPLGGGPNPANSLVDIGNVNASDNVALATGSITATTTSSVKSIDIAGLVHIAGVTGTASATSDGNAGTPTANLNVGQVTVDGQTGFIDATGVHIPITNTAVGGISPAQLQQTLNGTFGQDGITVTIIKPTLTSNGGQASADAGGLKISIAHQLDVPFVPGEPNVPLPQLGNQGLPAGQYTVTTSIIFGLAQATVSATALASQVSVLPSTPIPTTTSVPPATALGNTGNTGNTGTFGSLGSPGFPGSSSQSLGATGPGSGGGTASPISSLNTAFPVAGVPAPLGWAITALLACFIFCYPLLLLARYQFIPRGRRR
ncbi:MAG TPA: hypothetical protein VND70_10420 [Acidimicrobiales bacterium]|nr:hypothetical protein [Acidimicrobiales bacterium]